MQTKVKRWGNSLAVRIPGVLARRVGLTAESDVELKLEEDRLIISPLEGRQKKLEELIEKITYENTPEEVEWGIRVGREEW